MKLLSDSGEVPDVPDFHASFAPYINQARKIYWTNQSPGANVISSCSQEETDARSATAAHRMGWKATEAI
jgi:hypothetical protein